MKNNILLLILLCTIPMCLYAQEYEEIVEVPEEAFNPETDYIPYTVVEQKPRFKKCKSEKDQKECTDAIIKKHISKSLVFPKKYENDSLNVKVYTVFKIDRKGKIIDVKTRIGRVTGKGTILPGDDKLFEQEAIRVIESLPKMIPGEYRGQKVIVAYTTLVEF